MGYNCGTCKLEFPKPYSNGMETFCVMGREQRYDAHPADLHPCEHGEAIVASAVCGVEFRFIQNERVWAKHQHELSAQAEWYSTDSGNSWQMWADEAKFCNECGLRLPTTAELAMMYEKWMGEQAGKEQP